MKIKERTIPPVTIGLRKTKMVSMTIKIGNAQIGGSILQFEGDEEPFDKGRIKDVELGKGSVLSGKKLLIETNVLDSNTATNKIVIRHIFHYNEGDTIETITIEDEVEEHRDIFSCTATYLFNEL
jgi:hypothetical protein